MNTSDILYIDSNKKRADGWLQTLRLQLPSSVTNYGSVDRVAYYEPNVNTAYGGNDRIGFSHTLENVEYKAQVEQVQAGEKTYFNVHNLNNEDEYGGDIRYSRNVDGLTNREYNILNSKLMQKTGDIIKLTDGGYAVPVGEVVGTPNKLVITDGNIENPSVETVFAINYDNENIDTTSIIGEYLNAKSRQILRKQKQDVEDFYGQGCITEYTFNNSGEIPLHSRGRKGSTGTESAGDNGQSGKRVRYHFDDAGDFVEYSRTISDNDENLSEDEQKWVLRNREQYKALRQENEDLEKSTTKAK